MFGTMFGTTPGLETADLRGGPAASTQFLADLLLNLDGRSPSPDYAACANVARALATVLGMAKANAEGFAISSTAQCLAALLEAKVRSDT